MEMNAFGDAQLKLWMRRIQTEMDRGTSPQDALDLIKGAMEAQTEGQNRMRPDTGAFQKAAKHSC